jgi:hypothetical protein
MTTEGRSEQVPTLLSFPQKRESILILIQKYEIKMDPRFRGDNDLFRGSLGLQRHRLLLRCAMHSAAAVVEGFGMYRHDPVIGEDPLQDFLRCDIFDLGRFRPAFLPIGWHQYDAVGNEKIHVARG